MSMYSSKLNKWINQRFLEAKRIKRIFERAWRKNKTTFNRSRYKRQVHYCNRLASEAKEQLYSNILSEHQNDPRKTWKSINKVLHKTVSPVLPDYSCLKTLAESFSSFFINKISKIRSMFNIIHDENQFVSSSEKSTGTLSKFDNTFLH